MNILSSYTRKHTPVPQSLKEFTSERSRAEETYKKRILTPEEMAEVIAKYGPPKMPLKDRRSVMHHKKKGKPA